MLPFQTHLTFGTEFTQAVEQKQVAQQDAERARYLVEKVRSDRIALANSMEPNLGCTMRVYFDNVMLMSQKPCQHNNKFDCCETNGYNIPQ